MNGLATIQCHKAENQTKVSGRTLAVIDIENLLATADPTARSCIALRHVVQRLLPETSVQIVNACSHHAARIAAFTWPEARWKFRSGPNGADLALIEELIPIRLRKRFEHVVIGSGDGIFSPIAHQLVNDGIQVTVMSRRNSLSRHLAINASDVIYLPTPELHNNRPHPDRQNSDASCVSLYAASKRNTVGDSDGTLRNC